MCDDMTIKQHLSYRLFLRISHIPSKHSVVMSHVNLEQVYPNGNENANTNVTNGTNTATSIELAAVTTTTSSSIK
jgi:hypothetical protein